MTQWHYTGLGVSLPPLTRINTGPKTSNLEGHAISKRKCNELWKQQRPRAISTEAMGAKMRAMKKLAHRTAKDIKDKIERDVRIAIRSAAKDDPDLRAIGMTDQEANALVTVTMRLINEG